jgi:SOS-response transcriptional repressor LexA
MDLSQNVRMEAPKHRLQQAREAAGFESPSDAARALKDINKNTLISNENGNRPISRKAAEKYGRLFNVDPGWLLFGVAGEDVRPTVTDVPMVSLVSAGQFVDNVHELSDLPTIPAINLPEGDWIAMRVDGPSMNKISPPDSIIFVNTRDKRLVSNGCYIIADETGAATYKRYRPNEHPPFQPASYEEVEPPRLEGAIKVIGRVKRSIIEM